MIEQAQFTYSPLEKAFENQAKAIKVSAEKETKGIENRINKKKQIEDTVQESTMINFDFVTKKQIHNLIL